MVYTYLLKLYQALDSRRDEINNEISRLAGNADNTDQLEFMQGRIAASNEIISFLRNRYHSKLPRRIQKTDLPS